MFIPALEEEGERDVEERFQSLDWVDVYSG